MNKKLVLEIESVLDKNNDLYIKQLLKAQDDFWEYCKPGSVNNWQHPEKPEIQTSLVLAANIFKPNRILDFGTGLTGFSFRKYLPQVETVSIDSSFFWAVRLSRYLEYNKLKIDNLYFYHGEALFDVSKILPEEVRNVIASSPLKVKMPVKHAETGEHVHLDALLYHEPSQGFVFVDTREASVFKGSLENVDPYKIMDTWQSNPVHYYGFSPDSIEGKFLPDSVFHITNTEMANNNKQNFETLGKFDFIHYDFGHMYTRVSYLNVAIDLLDRSKDSLIYIDDIHKQKTFWNNKSYKNIVDEIVEEHGGIWLDCGEALKDFQGGCGGLAYFPPMKIKSIWHSTK